MIHFSHRRGDWVKSTTFNYSLANDTIIFADAIKKGSPYIAETPRNHESLFFVTNGTGIYDNYKTKVTISKGQVGYIGRGSSDIFSAYRCDSVSYIAVNFNFARDEGELFATLPFDSVCSFGNFYNYERLFKDALSCFRTQHPGSVAVSNGIILQIIGNLYNEHVMKGKDIKKIRRVEKLAESLKNNYHDPDFKVSSLALDANMSEKHIRRLFFDVYNKTPYTYLQEFRINNAEILLSNTAKSISDIAEQCGFSDVYSFSHCFKKHTGLSPSEYRYR